MYLCVCALQLNVRITVSGSVMAISLSSVHIRIIHTGTCVYLCMCMSDNAVLRVYHTAVKCLSE